jgi:hypothetical protein
MTRNVFLSRFSLTHHTTKPTNSQGKRWQFHKLVVSLYKQISIKLKLSVPRNWLLFRLEVRGRNVFDRTFFDNHKWVVKNILNTSSCNRPNAKVQVMICRYTISLPCMLKTKDCLDDTIVLCMIVRLIVYSAYNYSPFAFGLYRYMKH